MTGIITEIENYDECFLGTNAVWKKYISYRTQNTLAISILYFVGNWLHTELIFVDLWCMNWSSEEKITNI